MTHCSSRRSQNMSSVKHIRKIERSIFRTYRSNTNHFSKIWADLEKLSMSSFDRSLVRISKSDFEVRPITKIKHLNWSFEIFDNVKSSQFLLIRPWYVIKSISSFFCVFKHLKRTLKIDLWVLKSLFNVWIVSSNVKSAGNFGKMMSKYFEWAFVSNFRRSNRNLAASSKLCASDANRSWYFLNQFSNVLLILRS